jgi:hypothetical protein
VISGQAKAACDANEIMISAYCTVDRSTLHVDGTAGASCEGPQGTEGPGTTTVVVVCAKR